MKKLLRVVVVACSFLSFVRAVEAQPANDNFANAWPLSGLAATTNGNSGQNGVVAFATREAGEPMITGRNGGRSVWFRWTAPVSGRTQIDTSGSAFNTLLGVYTGTAVNVLTLVAQNDNGPNLDGQDSAVEFDATAGTIYRIAVDGRNNNGTGTSSGAYILNVEMIGSAVVTSPTNGNLFAAGSPIRVNATATVPGDSVSYVELYRGDFNVGFTFLGSVTNAPYTLTTTNSPLGTNLFAAVAYDTQGRTWVSAFVSVLVLGPGVTIVSPSDGGSFFNLNPITVNALTLLSGGAITNVDFYADGQKFGSDASSPFSAVWNTVVSGLHRLTAVGKANNSINYTSPPVLISVARTLVASNSVWKYLDTGVDEGTAWTAPGFDDASWSSGPAQLGYGDGDEATVVSFGPDPVNKYITTYFRRSFVVTNTAAYETLVINVIRDDGAVVYLNGQEAARYNMPSGPVTFTTRAPQALDDGVGYFSAAASGTLLVEGTNVLAVEIHQNAPDSSDISFDLEMTGIPSIPRNQPPLVNLLTPVNGDIFLGPSPIEISASASDPDGSVARVEFFADGVKLGEATNSPYAYTWTNAAIGWHSIYAVASDLAGASATSAASAVTVYDAAGTPLIQIFNPDNGEVVEGPTNIAITAFASAVSALTNVEFFAGTNFIGRSTPVGDEALVADYQFENSLADVLGKSPALVNLGANTFGTATVDGQNRTILHFPQSTGLSLNQAAAVIPGNVYTIVMLFSFEDVTSWRRLLDFKNGLSDNGLYLQSGGLDFYPEASGPTGLVPAGTFAQAVLTRDAAGNVSGYLNGVQQFSFADSIGNATLEASGVLRFFRDDNGEDAAGAVARLRIYDKALSSTQVASLDRLPGLVTLGEVFSFVWTNAAFGSNLLRAVAYDSSGLVGTSAVVHLTITTPPTNTVAPTIAAVNPPRTSTLTNLTTIQVTFSERVVGVDASDLLVNLVPATSVTGSGSNYTFTIVQPAFGSVEVIWAVGHGITDIGFPSALPFNALAPGASWDYFLTDLTPPTIVARNPPAGASVSNLTQVGVTFSERVSGVDAADLLIDGSPAIGLTGSGSNYTFSFSQPAAGNVNLSWAAGHGIADLAAPPNAFNGATAGWNYTLDNRTLLVQSNSTWQFIKGLSEASVPIDAWRQIGFDDSSWSNALAPFYYGDPYNSPANPGTLLSDMRGGYSSIYLRQAFVVNDASAVTNLFFNAQSDDGFIAWINGVEIMRYNMAGGDIPHDGTAPSAITEPNNTGAGYILTTLSNPRAYLVEGTNVLAVHAFNNQPTTSSDFGFNAQLYTFVADPKIVPPRIASVTPPAGELFFLSNIVVRFSEPVSGVDAADLLINGVAASSMTSTTNTTYAFQFAQPPFGTVAISWAGSHGIADFDSPPKPFDGTSAGSRFSYNLLNPSAPTVVGQVPAAGATINHFSELTVTFNEPVTGVNASDLLINGSPATSISGGPVTYTFTFASPALGVVSVGWAAAHGITDLETPANAFDRTRPANSWTYTFVDQTPPTIASKSPPAGAQVTNLTQITVVFSEPVSGVNAGDLRINGNPATGLTGGPTTYTFSFPQANATTLQISWVPNHGIRDLAVTPNPFDGTGPGATWTYTTPDNVAPAVASIDPPPNVTVRSLSQIRVTFTEPVVGVDTNDLLLNGRKARQIAGSGAGPYTFTYLPPSNGVVEVRWTGSNGIIDLASPPNSFAGGEWTYTLDPNADFAGKIVLSEIMFNPAGGLPAHEWIELRNVATNLINLTGWRFSRGVDFTFPNVSIAAGAYLVVAANVEAFQTNYPGVTNVVGGWTGQLANTEETIDLVTALGDLVNSVHYATAGDWARRERGRGASRVSSVTISGNVATFTVFAHGLTSSDRVMISGADQPEYNGIFVPSNIGTSTFSVTLPGTPGPATGNILSRQIVDDGISGWAWFSAADGLGSSMELVNAALPNASGQNWLPSLALNGTPGRANSTATNNIAPSILDVTHSPAVPRSTSPVSITARVRDELSNGVASVTLFYRNHTTPGPGAFQITPMLDNGASGDGSPGDGLYGVTLPPATNRTVIEFYVQATDTTGHSRTWPAPAWDTNNTFAQLANAYYQVDDESIAGTMPALRVIFSGTEHAIYAGQNRNSDAEQNVTVVSSDAEGTKIRYLGGLRVRGAGSRSRTPANNRVNFPNDNPWNGLNGININGQFVHSQLMGAAVARKSGLPAADAHLVQYRTNGANPAPLSAPVNGSGNGAGYGTFLLVEPVNGDLAANVFPQDGAGNVYRASTGNHNADLSYQGSNPNSYLSRGYTKTANQTANDWTDLFNLTFAFSQVANQADYVRAIRTNLNVTMWMRYFALGTLINYGETSLFNGIGDDFALYRGLSDPRFVLIGHDFDTIFGQGDTGPSYYPINTNSSIFIMLNPPSPESNVPLLRRFMTEPEFAPIFYSELKRLADTVFLPSQINALFDQLLTGWGPTSTTINDMKTYAANRRSVVLSQIPLALTVTSTLGTSNGVLFTSIPTVTLSGTAHAIDTRKVLAGGAPAAWDAFAARWTSTLNLQPGLNRVLVQSLNSNDVEFARSTVDIWYDDGSVQSVSGAIATDSTWSAAAGPYQVTGNLTIGAGTTLTILPGTTVYLAAGVTLTVADGGRLLAEGTDAARIRFARVPGGGNWGGITVDGGANSPETRITYADFQENNSTAIHSSGGTLFLGHLTFGNPGAQYISLDGSSFVVEDCVFPSITGSFEPVHGTQGIKAGGYGIVRRNFWGRVNGYNDAFDFTGGNRPGPILQVLNNVFVGTDDDLLDLDSTDAWIEGNIFLHVHRNGAPDSSSAISGGADNADTSQITAIGNLFYDVDQAANAKQGNFYTFFNNTIVNQNLIGSQDTESGVITLADYGTALGLGFYLEGNIISGAEKLVRTQGVAQVTFTNNITHQLAGVPWTGPGGNNSTNDPLFVHVPLLSETTNFTSWESAQVMWQWFALRPGSPALSSGPAGRDKGAVASSALGEEKAGLRGAAISGEPIGLTPANTAVLRVGPNRTGNGIPAAGFPNGSGYTHYRWRLDGGAWSAETPIATPITLSGLGSGPHYVEVSGKNDAGFYQDDPIFGEEAVVTLSRTWTVSPGASPLRLNEVLAANSGAFVHVGTTPDAIELVNTGSTPIDLFGVGLTDDPANPAKYLFPSNTVLAAGAYLTVLANNVDGTPGLHIGFNLAQGGAALYLFDSGMNGGALVDSIAFGPQLNNLSIGRLADGSWALTQPTLGAPNRGAPTGDPASLRINEWLTLGTTPFANDFIELYNADPLPVPLGGLYLSDEIIGWPDRHRIAALSFIAGNGYQRFIADGSPNQGAEHLNFTLSPEQGEIGLFTSNLVSIDCIYYQPQLLNQSQGRSPNGSVNIVYFNTPTPGAPNPLYSGPEPNGNAVVINEVLANNASVIEDGRTPDWIEIYNGTTGTVNLGDMSLTDDTLLPRRFVFAPDTMLASGGFLRVLCDTGSTNSNPLVNTNFALKSTGGGVYLFDKPTSGGSLSNSIIYGIQTPDFTIGRVPDGSTNWVLTTPTPGTANAPVATFGDLQNLKVNEWMANPTAGNDDWFEIYNPTTLPVALGGLYLTDDLNIRTRHQIAPLSFLGTGTNAFQRFVADGNTGAGADHVGFSLSALSEAVGLSTAAGTLIDGYTFGPQGQGVSEGRFPDGSANVVTFPGTASPGESNWRWLTNVVINEVLTHSDLPLEDAIELRNLTGAALDVGGWWLSDDNGTLKKYQIPSPTVIPPNGFTVIYENVFTNNALAAFPFALSSKGDEVVLSASTNNTLTGYRTRVSFGAAPNGASFGRYLTSDGREEFVVLSGRTFGVDDPGNVEEFRHGTGAPNVYPLVGPVVISEIMYHPPDIGTNDNVADEYIELHNITTVPVPLYDPNASTNTWHLRDAVDFDFATGTVIPPGGRLLVVSFDPVNNPTALDSFRTVYGIAPGTPIVGPYSGKLANDTDEIELRRPDVPNLDDVPYILVERVRYFDLAPWPDLADGIGLSLQRISDTGFGNDATNWVADLPTPGPQTSTSDSDNDGLPDAWEIANGFDPFNPADAALDTDGDGLSNLQEYQAGSDPRNAKSGLHFTSIALDVSGSNVVLTFTAIPNVPYTVEVAATLGGAWQNYQDIAPAPVTRVFHLSVPATGAARFFRLRATPGSAPPEALRFTSIKLDEDGAGVVFTFTAVSNHTYTIEETTALGGAWQTYQNVAAAPTNRVLSFTVPATGPSRFFRLRTPWTSSPVVPHIDAIQPVTGSQVRVTFEAVANQGYTLLFGNDLLAGPWTAIGNYPAASTNRSIQVVTPATQSKGFYRLRSP